MVLIDRCSSKLIFHTMLRYNTGPRFGVCVVLCEGRFAESRYKNLTVSQAKRSCVNLRMSPRGISTRISIQNSSTEVVSVRLKRILAHLLRLESKGRKLLAEMITTPFCFEARPSSFFCFLNKLEPITSRTFWVLHMVYTLAICCFVFR